MLDKIIQALRDIFVDTYKHDAYTTAKSKREARITDSKGNRRRASSKRYRISSGVIINAKQRSQEEIDMSRRIIAEEERSYQFLHKFIWRKNKNPWVPPEFRSILLAGELTEAQKQGIQDDLERKRSVWKPTQDAYDLLDILQRDAVGRMIIAKFYDLFWATLDERDGIKPVLAECVHVEIVEKDQERYNLPQVYIYVVKAKALSLGMTSPFGKLLEGSDEPSRFNLGDLYELLILD